MDQKYAFPDCIFEISWEVCNKVGGIYTVLSTKARTLASQEVLEMVYIGPDLWENKNTALFTEDKKLWSKWKKDAQKEGLNVRCGYWEIPGRPTVILVDFSSFLPIKEKLYTELWNDYKVDSLHAYGDYDDSMMFGYAAGRVVESFSKHIFTPQQKIVLQAHEWQTGYAALYIKKNMPRIGTIFTTHATTVGRSIASNNKYLYEYFNGYNGDQMATELNVESKHSIEKQTALNVDCFTTVSLLTARECKQFLSRDVDVILENGFEKDFVPVGAKFTQKRKAARKLRIKVAEALTGTSISENALIVGIGGRMEMRNKGIDLLLESVRRLIDSKFDSKDILVCIDVPAWCEGPRKDLLERLKGKNSKWSTPLEDPFLTHSLNNMNEDVIVAAIRSLELTNNDNDSKVKVIYSPSYMNSFDGIYNLDYYDLFIGNDLNIYPSYYEPWGYTPLESIAFHIPTVTTDLAGFGLWVNSLLGRKAKLQDGVKVINRTDTNYFKTADEITKTICKFTLFSDSDITTLRQKATKISEKALWKHFILNYYNAYKNALSKSLNR